MLDFNFKNSDLEDYRANDFWILLTNQDKKSIVKKNLGLFMNPFQAARLQYIPQTPKNLQNLSEVVLRRKNENLATASHIKHLFPKTWDQKGYEVVPGNGKVIPLRLGVLFSGGQAPGGHNVITGIFDALQKISSSSQLIGFLGGPSGLLDSKWKYLKSADIDEVRNTGGFDFIGSGRTKIETQEQISKAMQACKELSLDGLVIIGGDDSNTNAAILAEYFLQNDCRTKVIGIPKTIDGDLRTKEIEISFGFDSACKTYAEIIGNICKDAISAKKYYHFIKLMGRSASNITLECALLTQVNLALIAEESLSLQEIVENIAKMILLRSQNGKNYGVILIPEGLFEFIPEMKSLIGELNQLIAKNLSPQDLKPKNKALFDTLPKKIQNQLMLDRDPHGNIALSQIDTEYLLIELVQLELKKTEGYKGKFNPISHFLGYEGRSCYPTNFDANYCYSLGKLAVLAIRDEATGMMCAISNLKEDPSSWHCQLIPIVQTMNMEERHGIQKAVISKALVDLDGPSYQKFISLKHDWLLHDEYISPGPIQFFGPEEIINQPPLIVKFQ